MVSNDETLGYALLGLLIWILILYAIIKGAVSSALDKKMKTQNYNLIMLNRLLIKQLLKQGYSKKELQELHNQDSNQFWDSIEEPKE